MPDPVATCARAASRPLLIATLALLLAAPCRAAPQSAASPDFWQRKELTGDWGGLRTKLDDDGIAFALTEIDDVQVNPIGGMGQGAGYDGALEFDANADLDTLLGWTGASIDVTAGEFRGHGVSTYDVGNLMPVSNIETSPMTELFDAYLKQSLFDDRFTMKFGELAANDAFFESQYASYLINSTFGWPAIMNIDLSSQDPSAAPTTPGAEFKLQPTTTWSAQLGIYEGELSHKLEDSVFGQRDPGQGVFTVAETGYRAHGNLPAAYRVGAWYHSAAFDDQRFDSSGRSLAATLYGAPPRRHSGDWGFYAVIDQTLWHTQKHGLGAFFRIAAVPQDRNFVSFYADGGIALGGTFPGRIDDVAALGIAWAGISDRARALDQDIRDLGYTDYPRHNHEVILELTYQVAMTGWWTVQPDLQYVLHPGGSSTDPLDLTGNNRIHDALVVGLRSTLKF